MATSRPVECLTIYLSQTEHKGRAPDYVTIVERAREAGLAGATVVQGVEGYGSSARVHRPHTFGGSQDVPVVVMVVESPERVTTFLDGIAPLLEHALVLRQAATVVVERDDRGNREQRER